MSQERAIETTAGTIPDASLAAAQEKDPEELKRIRAEKKARLVRVLARGYTNDRLTVDMPPGVYGEWILNDPLSIQAAEAIGFKMDTEIAKKQLAGVHDTGDGRSVVGDVVFMVMDSEDKELHEEIRREAFELANGKPGQERGQKEEREFVADARAAGLPIVEESRNRTARKAELEAALRRNAGADPGVTATGSGPVQQVIR